MTTKELIEAITKTMVIISLTQIKEGNESAERYLRRMQLLLNKARPITLHTQN